MPWLIDCRCTKCGRDYTSRTVGTTEPCPYCYPKGGDENKDQSNSDRRSNNGRHVPGRRLDSRAGR